MRLVARIASGALFCVSLLCCCAVSENMKYQIPWTLFWMLMCAVSGRIFMKTKDVDNSK